MCVDPILSQINVLSISTFCFVKIHLNRFIKLNQQNVQTYYLYIYFIISHLISYMFRSATDHQQGIKQRTTA